MVEPEAYERHDALHAEMMAAYADAEKPLDAYLTSRDPADLADYRAAMRRAFRLSNDVHLESDNIMLVYYSRRDAANGS